MPEILKGLASLPQEQLIRKYYFPYKSDEAEHSADPPPNFGRGLRTWPPTWRYSAIRLGLEAT
jgi:hypothetical protein